MYFLREATCDWNFSRKKGQLRQCEASCSGGSVGMFFWSFDFSSCRFLISFMPFSFFTNGRNSSFSTLIIYLLAKSFSFVKLSRDLNFQLSLRYFFCLALLQGAKYPKPWWADSRAPMAAIAGPGFTSCNDTTEDMETLPLLHPALLLPPWIAITGRWDGMAHALGVLDDMSGHVCHILPPTGYVFLSHLSQIHDPDQESIRAELTKLVLFVCNGKPMHKKRVRLRELGKAPAIPSWQNPRYGSR